MLMNDGEIVLIADRCVEPGALFVSSHNTAVLWQMPLC